MTRNRILILGSIVAVLAIAIGWVIVGGDPTKTGNAPNGADQQATDMSQADQKPDFAGDTMVNSSVGSAKTPRVEAGRESIILPKQVPSIEELSEKADKAVPAGVFRFATGERVNLSPKNSGKWEDLGTVQKWRLQITSPEAVSLNLGFSKYVMPNGGQLRIFAPENEAAPTYRAFTSKDNETHQQLWTPIVRGDEIVIEAIIPTEAVDDLKLELAQVSHGFRGFRPKSAKDTKIGGDTSASCNIDVICDGTTLPGGVGALIDGMRDQIRSVGAYTLGGVDACSGTLLNNVNGDLVPYFLTAAHCDVTVANAASMVVYWNFENSTCRTPGSAASGQVGDGDLSQFNTGAIFRAADAATDFCLVELDDDPDPTYNLHFAGWDNSIAVPTMSTGIHHPAVAEKRISFDLDSPTITDADSADVNSNAGYFRIIDWDHGTTEGGSSGSGLFNENGRVVGQLFGGDSACGNGLADWYGRFSSSWTGGGTAATQLSNWLDPSGFGSGSVTMDGIDQDDVLSIDDVTVTEGDSGTVAATFTVSLIRRSNDTVSAQWSTQDGTATSAGNDFTVIDGSVNFLPEEDSKTVTVQVNGDVAQEDNETFSVILSNPSSAEIGDGEGTATITNDDFFAPPVITSPATAEGLQDSLFTYQIEASNFPNGFAFAATPPAGMTVDSNGLVSWTPSVFGPFQFEVRATSPAGMGDQTVTVTIAENSIGNALDNTAIPFSTSGALPWNAQAVVTSDGVDAAQSGAITHLEESVIQFTVTGPDHLVFDWKVSSEAGFDFFQLRKTGETLREISGDVDWTREVIEVPAGTATYQFRYLKDSDTSEGADAGYVDKLFLASSSTNPIITSSTSDQAIGNSNYSYQIETTQPASSFTATGLPAGLSLNPGTGLISGIPTEIGSFTVALSATEGGVTETSTLALVVSAALPGMTNAVGSDLSWGTSGDSNWFIQNAISRDGQAVQSGNIGDLEASSLFTRVEGPSDFIFYWKVSSEAQDDLIVFIDGVENSRISGIQDWARKNILLGEGSHSVEFRYEKDLGTAENADAGWIDSVEVIPFPSAVTGTSATDGDFDHFVTVTWTPPTESVDQYIIYRATVDDSGQATEIGTSTLPEYGDSTAVRGTQYYYFVRAENSAGLGPIDSGDDGFAAPDLPAASTQISATNATLSDRVDIQWNFVPGLVDLYTLYRTDNVNTPPTVLTTRSKTSNSFSDATAIPGILYYYTVVASNIAGDGPASTSDVGARRAPAPTGVTATSSNPNQIDIIWDPPVFPVDNHRVYRNGASNDVSGAILIAELNGTETSYTDISVNPGLSYAYFITAVNDNGGESAFSSSVSGTRLYVLPEGVVQSGAPTPGPGETNAVYAAEAKGTFTGLINDDSATGDEVKLFGNGRISISHSTKTDSGTASTTLIYQGGTYKLKAPFLADGSATIGFTKRDEAKTPMTLTLQLVDSDLGSKLIGTITGDGETGVLNFYKLVFHRTKNKSEDAGRYTMVMPHDEGADHSLVPGGDGVGATTVGIDGRVRAVGVLGDGAKLSLSTFLSADGEIAAYRKLYNRDATGWVGGMLRLNDVDNVSSVDGMFQWFKGADTRQTRYADGFDLQQGAVVSTYTAPNARAQEFLISDLRDGTGNAILYLTGGNLNSNIGALGVTWSRKNRITLDSRIRKEVLKPKVRASTGLVTGSYVDKAAGVTAKFYGIAFQEQDRVVGNFPGTGRTGYFQITPNGAPDLNVTRATPAAAVTNGDSFAFGDTGFEGGFGEIGFFIQNDGIGSLHLRSVPEIVTTSPEDFAVSFSNSGFLAPGERTLIRVRFQPQAIGAETATLRILTNDETDNPFEILLTGNAVAGTGGLGKENLPSSNAVSPANSLELTSSTAAVYDILQNGTFRGLINQNIAGNPVNGITSLKMSSNKTTGFGVLSGTVIVEGKRLSLKGEIIADGSFTGDFLKSAALIWTPTIQVQETAGGATQIVGLLTNEDTGETYNFVADPNRFHKTKNPAPMSGRYTTVLPATAEVYQVYPGGHGYGGFAVSTSGTTKMRLVLANGSKFTISGFVSEDAQIQLYNARLSGVVTFREEAGISDIDGDLMWNLPANSRATRYSKGFSGPIAFVGSTYNSVPASGWLLPSIEAATGAAFVSLEGLDLSENKSITWAQNNRFTYVRVGKEILRVKVSKKFGFVSGYWWDRNNGKPKRTFGGVIHQKQDGVFGTVINGLTTGRFEITD